jgi:hypothetical protein
MTLLIAALVIYSGDMHWAMYLVAVAVWALHVWFSYFLDRGR